MTKVLTAVRGLLGPDVTGARQSSVALAISALTGTGAGVALASITDTLAELPGMLVLVPAAIGMRGNIFGALGSRLATTIHTGTFTLSRRVDTVVGQNVVASIVLSITTAIVLGVSAKLVADASGLEGTISVADLIVVSVVGGVLASFVVLVVTLALAAGSARNGWDLDNVNAPLVSAVGDIVTLPALFAATVAVGHSPVTPILAGLFVIAAIVATMVSLRSRLSELVQIVRESLPILILSGIVLAFAGVVIEHRFAEFDEFPALLILVPSALGAAGAVGGILSSRLSSKLHLGLVSPHRWPDRNARGDIVNAGLLALPVFVLNGVFAVAASTIFGLRAPSVVSMVGIAVVAGMLATTMVIFIAYYGTVAALRLGVDPDTYGIPIVTSVVDVVGAYTLVLAMTMWGLS